MYEERDLSHGQQMVECFKPFLRHLVSSGPSRRTLRLHRDNLWILGGEIISKLHEDPQLRKRPTDQIVLAVPGEEGQAMENAKPFDVAIFGEAHKTTIAVALSDTK